MSGRRGRVTASTSGSGGGKISPSALIADYNRSNNWSRRGRGATTTDSITTKKTSNTRSGSRSRSCRSHQYHPSSDDGCRGSYRHDEEVTISADDICADLEKSSHLYHHEKQETVERSTTANSSSPVLVPQQPEEEKEVEVVEERGVVFRPQTIVKVAEEFSNRREQVRNLSKALQDKDRTITKLRLDMNRIRNSLQEYRLTSQTEFQRQRMVATNQIRLMEKKVESKQELVEHYQTSLKSRNRDFQKLQQDLREAKKREIQLGIELETHDFKFASYENYKRRVDSEELENIGHKTSENRKQDGPFPMQVRMERPTEAFSITGACSRRSKSSRIPETKDNDDFIQDNNHMDDNKQYIRKLEKDFEDMEKMYVRSKIDAADKITTLGEQLQHAYARIETLTNRISSLKRQQQHQQQKNETSFESGFTAPLSFESDGNNIDDIVSSIPSSNQNAVDFIAKDGGVGPTDFIRNTIANLKKSVEALEFQNAKYAQEIQRLHHEAENTKIVLQERDESLTDELALLKVENSGYIQKIASLQIELGLLYPEDDEDSKTKLKRYKILEKNLDQYIVDVQIAEEQLRMKERIINRLRMQLVEKRVADDVTIAAHQESRPIDEADSRFRNNLDATNCQVGTNHSSSVNSAELESQLTLTQYRLKYVQSRYAARVAKLKLQNACDLYHATTKQKQKQSNVYFI